MLELLVKYAEDHGLVIEPGFAPKWIKWAIVCSADGVFLDVIELGDTDQRKNPGQEFARCPELSQAELVSGGTRKSHFLADSAEVVALHKDHVDIKIQEKHSYFKFLLKSASEAMPQLNAVATMLADQESLGRIRECLTAKRVKSTDRITFRIDNSYPLDSKEWHDWWRSFRKSLSESKILPAHSSGQESTSRKSGKGKKTSGNAFLMRCFASGELIEPARTQPKIEGLADVGGQPVGTTLIGFDKDSFCSYTLTQSFNAAVSEEKASTYRAALNHLIRNQGHKLAGTKITYWFKEEVPPEEDPLVWLREGEEDQERNALRQARPLIEGIRTGTRPPSMGGNYYYAMTLSGSGGRVMVRDWMEGQFEELAGNVLQWFDDLSIVHRDGQGLALSPKFLAVAGATVRDLDNLTAPFVTSLWRTAVRGTPFPQSALAQALRRAEIGFMKDESPNHARMGILKAYHVRKQRLEGGNSMSEDLKPYLNENHPHPAYHCGRLMAVLARVQRAALGDVGAGVVQRYYAAASSTPALVLGRLTRTSQFHLNKLEHGLALWFERSIAEIWGRIEDNLPRTLTLEEQSLFALGYYQQLAHRTEKKSVTAENQEGTNE